MSIKLDSLIKSFDGSINWSDWLTKFKVVCIHNQWDTDAQKSRFMVMLLEGTPLRIVQLIPEEKRTFEAMSRKLSAAYGIDKGEAHRKLVARKYIKGEAPENLYYELIDLWMTSTDTTSPSEADQFRAVLPFFLEALPRTVAELLRMNGSTASAESLMEDARGLLARHVDEDRTDEGGKIGAFQPRGPFQGQYRGQQQSSHRNTAPVGQGYGLSHCPRCGDRQHKVEHCPYTTDVCHWCRKTNHRYRDCRSRLAGKPRAVGFAAVSGNQFGQQSGNGRAHSAGLQWSELEPRSH